MNPAENIRPEPRAGAATCRSTVSGKGQVTARNRPTPLPACAAPDIRPVLGYWRQLPVPSRVTPGLVPAGAVLAAPSVHGGFLPALGNEVAASESVPRDRFGHDVRTRQARPC